MFSVSTNKARKQRAYSLNRGHGQKQISVSRTQGEFDAFSKGFKTIVSKIGRMWKIFSKRNSTFH